MKRDKISLRIGIAILMSLSLRANAFAEGTYKVSYLQQQDTIVLSTADSLKIVEGLNVPYKKMGIRDTINARYLEKLPLVSLQQMLKSQIAGVYAQESSGEPGSLQNFYIRGLSSPILNESTFPSAQPQVYLNGIPLTVEHPFAYDVKQYSVNRIGTMTNTLAGINLNNIESVEVVKDPA